MNRAARGRLELAQRIVDRIWESGLYDRTTSIGRMAAADQASKVLAEEFPELIVTQSANGRFEHVLTVQRRNRLASWLRRE